MAQLVKIAAEGLMWFGAGFWSYADPRTAHLPMVRNPVPMATIIGLYLYAALSLGPRLMRDRKPFNLDRVMLVYNGLQVVACGYLMVEAMRVAWGGTYNWICEPLSKTRNQADYEIAKATWLYFILKIVDCLDTLFMIMRKNFHQVSFLHVYHHAVMIFCGWVCVKVVPGGHHTFLGPLNCGVHCLLYGYYFVSLLEPRVKGAWWKKYITIVQLVQFAMIGVHEAMPFFNHSCDVDWPFSALLFIQAVYMFMLFGDYYYKSFVVARPVRTEPVQSVPSHDKNT